MTREIHGMAGVGGYVSLSALRKKEPNQAKYKAKIRYLISCPRRCRICRSRMHRKTLGDIRTGLTIYYTIDSRGRALHRTNPLDLACSGRWLKVHIVWNRDAIPSLEGSELVRRHIGEDGTQVLHLLGGQSILVAYWIWEDRRSIWRGKVITVRWSDWSNLCLSDAILGYRVDRDIVIDRLGGGLGRRRRCNTILGSGSGDDLSLILGVNMSHGDSDSSGTIYALGKLRNRNRQWLEVGGGCRWGLHLCIFMLRSDLRRCKREIRRNYLWGAVNRSRTRPEDSLGIWPKQRMWWRVRPFEGIDFDQVAFGSCHGYDRVIEEVPMI